MTLNLKYGRRPPTGAPAMKLADVLSGVVPAHPDSADYLANLTNWQMLGNDTYGDCVSVTWANERRLLTAVLGGAEVYPTLTQVIQFYKTQNPNFPSEDNGMVIQDALNTLVKVGGPDGVKALAFAKVDHRNVDEVKAALAIFGCLWVGITVQDANMSQFDQGEPWDYVRYSRIDGGHSVIVGGYGEARSGALGGDEDFITWGEETSFTDTFWSHNVEESWVVIWPEHLGTKAFEEGVDLAALASAYTALTGRPFPVPTPAPTPKPPVPTPPAPAPVPGTVTAIIIPSPTIPVKVAAELDAAFPGKWVGLH